MRKRYRTSGASRTMHIDDLTEQRKAILDELIEEHYGLVSEQSNWFASTTTLVCLFILQRYDLYNWLCGQLRLFFYQKHYMDQFEQLKSATQITCSELDQWRRNEWKTIENMVNGIKSYMRSRHYSIDGENDPLKILRSFNRFYPDFSRFPEPFKPFLDHFQKNISKI